MNLYIFHNCLMYESEEMCVLCCMVGKRNGVTYQMILVVVVSLLACCSDIFYFLSLRNLRKRLTVVKNVLWYPSIYQNVFMLCVLICIGKSNDVSLLLVRL